MTLTFLSPAALPCLLILFVSLLSLLVFIIPFSFFPLSFPIFITLLPYSLSSSFPISFASVSISYPSLFSISSFPIVLFYLSLSLLFILQSLFSIFPASPLSFLYFLSHASLFPPLSTNLYR